MSTMVIRKALKVKPEVWQKIENFRRKNETMGEAIDRAFSYIEKISTLIPMMENSIPRPEKK